MQPPDGEQLDGLIFSGCDTPRDRFFLLGRPGRELIAFWHPKNAVMARIIEDNRLAAACVERLRCQGHPAFASVPEVYAYAARQGWPGWEQHQVGEPGATGDGGLRAAHRT